MYNINLFLSSITNQIIIIILLYSLLKLISYYQSVKKKKLTVNSSLESIEYIIKFINNFHVKNKWFTYISAIFYILGKLAIILLVRYNTLYTKYQTSSFIYILFCFIFYLVIIILLNILLNKILFTEILKLHIYLKLNKYYTNLCYFLTNFYLVDTFGKLYLFFFNFSNHRIITSQ